jgi:hypothetical protein
MATATSRVKTGKDQYIEPGQNVPDDIAKANPHLVSTADYKPAYDHTDPTTLDGEKAAADSVRMRPDNPDRPSSVEGESSWKVTGGGALGSGTPSPIAPRGVTAKSAAETKEAGSASPKTTIK